MNADSELNDIVEEARFDWIDFVHAVGVVKIVEGGEGRVELVRRAGPLVVQLMRQGRLIPGLTHGP